MSPTGYDTIPDELKQRDQWLLWDNRADRPKQPHWDGDHSISWSDPADWHSFEDAAAKAAENDHWGIGYVTAKQNDEYPRGLYWVIDIDGGLNQDGTLAEWVPDLAPFTDGMTYIERSPSGTGVHIPIVGHDVPEWWTDGQLDDHEGVDVLANKFCTFTGDVLEQSGSQIADIDPTSWLYKAYERVHGESPRIQAKQNQQSQYNGSGTELSEEQIAEALDHVDPDLPYQDWLRVGMAVYDWDSGSRGKRQFEQWSQTNPKWDASRGQHHIDDIWSGSPNGDVTVGTLVYHAKQGGWEPPRANNGDEEVTDEGRVHKYRELLDELNGVEDVPDEDRKRLATLAARVPEQVYDEERAKAAEILNLRPEQLNTHRELKQHYDDVGRIYVTDRRTYRLHDWVPMRKTEVLNFPFTIKSILQMREEEQIEAEFGPGRDKTFTPTDLQRNQRFKDLIGDFVGLTFDPGDADASDVLNDLNEYIASLDVPRRTGTHHIGLHEDELVLPDANLTAEGWTDTPETVYVDRGIGIERKITLDDSVSKPNLQDVQEILRTVPQTRNADRLLPVMAWFYAAPLRPYVFEEFAEGAFNHLNITGDTGSGKTTTLRYLWECFGVDGDPFDVTDTQFAKLATIASSKGLPIWYDEYKPSDMQDWRRDQFHDLYRKSATGGVAQRGKADQSTEEYHLHAPLVVSGEQQITSPAERRRSIMVSFRTDPTKKGNPMREQFKQLVGADYLLDGELQKPSDAPDPAEHALAYYRYILGLDPEFLHDEWHEARKTVARIRNGWPDEHDLDDMEIQGLQTIVWGYRLIRDFASDYGLDPDAVWTTDDLRAALRHVVSEVGPDGQRKSHLDEWVELVDRAAAMDYLEPGVHYKVVHEGQANEELRLNGRKTFDAISKYLRDHGLEDQDVLSDWGDYRKRFEEAAETEGHYVQRVSIPTNPIGRAVGISTIAAMRDLDFDRQRFGVDPMESQQDEPDDDDTDGSGPRTKADTIYQYVKDHEPVSKQDMAVALVQGADMTSDEFNHAFEKITSEGGIYETDDGYRTS